MKLLHLADLHIGKQINGYPMLKEQENALWQAVRMAAEHKVTAVLIAGDVYDKAVPPVEAVRLFDSFLTKLSKERITVCVVSGNHDSAERLSFGRSQLRRVGLSIAGRYEGEVSKVTFKDEFGEADVYLLPFLTPQQVLLPHLAPQQALLPHFMPRQFLLPMEDAKEKKHPENYTEAMKAVLEGLPVRRQVRNVLVTHQNVVDMEEFSKRNAGDGPAGSGDEVDYRVFDAFDYVALGHVHEKCHVGRKEVRYSGALLKYSFSEARQERSATLVTLGEKGDVTAEELPFTPLHGMREIKGTLTQLTDPEVVAQADVEDYLHVTLTDEEGSKAACDAPEKLRAVYRNLMQLDFEKELPCAECRDDAAAETLRTKGTLQLFGEFFLKQTGSPMTPMQELTMREVMDAAKAAE